MSDKAIVLPDRAEMLRRLVAVRDNSHYQERFYPILLKDAGQRRVAAGVVMMFTLAIHDYTQGMPPMVANLVHMDVPEFIDALVDDKEVAEAAKAFLKEALG
jgi:hypothetical protein